MILVILLASLAPVGYAVEGVGAPFLEIWPDARSTALAGATVSLIDAANSVPENPAALGFAVRGALLAGGPWIPGFLPGMTYARAASSLLPVRDSKMAAWLLDFRLLNLGSSEAVDTNGYFLGMRPVYRASLGAGFGRRLNDRLSIGAGARLAFAYSDLDLLWRETPSLGLDMQGTGFGAAVDLGALAHAGLPFDFISSGLTLSNLGPFLRLSGTSLLPMPGSIRFGLAAAPAEDRFVTVRYSGEINYPLFSERGIRWDNARKSLGSELEILSLFSIRSGYFEDLAGDRGGFVTDGEGNQMRYGLFDVLFGGLPAESRITSVGTCVGLGVGYRDYLRLDFASDATVYTGSPINWKLSLTANDLPGFARILRQRLPAPWYDVPPARKDPVSAVLRGLLVPGAGMLYAENYGAAAGYFIAENLLIGLAVYAAAKAQSGDRVQVLIPLTLWIGLRVYELARTPAAVGEYNARHGF